VRQWQFHVLGHGGGILSLCENSLTCVLCLCVVDTLLHTYTNLIETLCFVCLFIVHVVFSVFMQCLVIAYVDNVQ